MPTELRKIGRKKEEVLSQADISTALTFLSQSPETAAPYLHQ
jgi:hypothetical protein